MMTRPELQRLSRDLADTRVLSVYVDPRAADPAMRHAWMARLLAALRDARGTITDEIERFAFDRAAARLEQELPTPDGMRRPRGWVAFVGPDEVHHAAPLPVRPGTAVEWRKGPVIGPYLRALKQDRQVVTVLVDSRSARLHRYARGRLEPLEELSAIADDAPGAERITGPARHAPNAARGAVDTDAAQRRRLAAFRRLAGIVAQRVAHHAGDDGWVLVGGAGRWAQLAADALPRTLEGRTQVTTALAFDAPTAEVAAAAKRAATALRTERGLAQVTQLVDDARARGRGAAGARAVERALAAGAVDLLLVSHAFVRTQGATGEDLLRLALAQGAEVEVLSTAAGKRLDEVAGGIVARLRFAVGPEAAAPVRVPALAVAG